MKEIGFSVSCYKGDVPLLRGCLASIRYFAPDAPICLVIDGDFDSRPFEKRYAVSTIRRRDVKNHLLRELSFGYGVTKMPALWEAPFERIIHIDPDVVLWGDIRRNLPSEEWDFVHNEPHEVITDHIQRTQYFDPDKIFKYIEPFEWQGNPYFNSGVFACRVGALDLSEYLSMLRIQKSNPGLFFQDQAYLNIMVFRASQTGGLKRAMVPLQSCVPVKGRSELEEQFRLDKGLPVLGQKATSIHWAGPKPYTTNPSVFSLPMDYFRQIGMRDFGLPDWFPVKTAMRVDEFLHRNVPRTILNAKKSIKKIISPK